MLGLHLRKGHGAADWSTRPLPHDWLVYAALDVEVLVELRDAMEAVLVRQGKLEWAHAGVRGHRRCSAGSASGSTRGAGPPACTGSPIDARWPSSASSGSAGTRSRDAETSHRIGSCRTRRSSQRRPPVPSSIGALTALPVFSGRMQRRNADLWFAAISRAMSLPSDELPIVRPPGDGPPAPAKWASRDPARRRPATGGQGRPGRPLRAGRHAGGESAVPRHRAPGVVEPARRRGPTSAIAAALADRGARPWQIELTVPVLAAALDAPVAGQVTRQ